VTEKHLINVREDWLPVGFLALLPIVFLGATLFSTTNVIGSPWADARGQFFYTRLFGFSEVARFFLPLWNPHVYAGTPFVGTLQSAIFYPFNLLFTLLPIVPAMNWSISGHLALSGIFTYFLLKEYGVSRFGAVLAGVVYTFGAPQILHVYAGHLNALSAMVWTPLMFLLLEWMIRERSLLYSTLLGVTIALQFLAGQPQYVFYTMIALTLYLLFYFGCGVAEGKGISGIGAVSLLFLFAVVISIVLSAVQILPSLEMTRYSTRENLSFDWVAQFSLPPDHLITYLLPDFFGDMVKVPYWGKNYLWEMSAYIGIMPLILVICSVVRVERRIVWFFLWLAIVSLLFAFGKYTPLLKAAYTFVPGFHLFRGTSKFIFLNAFSLAVLSGFGVDQLVNTSREKGMRVLAFCGIASAMVVVALLITRLDQEWFRSAITATIRSVDFYEAPEQFMTSAYVSAALNGFRSSAICALGLLLVAAVVTALAQFRAIPRKLLMTLVLVVVVGDLFAFSSRYMVSFDSREAFGNQEILQFLQRDKEPFRVIAPEAEANFGMANGVETLGGYDTIMLKRFSEFINLSQGKNPDVPDLFVTITATNKLSDLLNTKYLLLGPKSVPAVTSGFQRVFSNGTGQVFQNSNAFPRTFVVHATKRVSGRQAMFVELAKPDFDPWSYALVEEELAGLPHDGASGRGKLPSIVSRSAGEVTIDADLDRPGLLILGDAWYPGWKALVDGRETKIVPANYVMRSVQLPAGKHRVEFRYAPASFRVGAMITLTALLLVVAIVLRGISGRSIGTMFQRRNFVRNDGGHE
jgi:uncharacterized membrane protein YfhO